MNINSLDLQITHIFMYFISFWWDKTVKPGGSDSKVSACNSEVKVKVAQLCLPLWDLMDYTVHGILQARTLEWVAFPFSRASSQPRDWTQVSYIAGKLFTS